MKNSGKTIYFTAEEKLAYDKARYEYIKKWKPPIVFISQSWSNLDSQESTKDLINLLGEVGSKVYFLEQPPELFFGEKNAPQFLAYYGLKPAKDNIKDRKQYVRHLNTTAYQQGRKILREISASCQYCELIPVADLFIKDDKGWVLDGEDVLYIDDDHLSFAGANKARGRMTKVLKEFYNISC